VHNQTIVRRIVISLLVCLAVAMPSAADRVLRASLAVESADAAVPSSSVTPPFVSTVADLKSGNSYVDPKYGFGATLPDDWKLSPANVSLPGSVTTISGVGFKIEAGVLMQDKPDTLPLAEWARNDDTKAGFTIGKPDFKLSFEDSILIRSNPKDPISPATLLMAVGSKVYFASISPQSALGDNGVRSFLQSFKVVTPFSATQLASAHMPIADRSEIAPKGAGDSIDAPSGYRLPFVGQKNIAQGPKCPFTHNAGLRIENAIDFMMTSGTTVYAARAGTVVRAGWDPSGGGNYMKVQHNDGNTSVYMHLDGFLKAEGESSDYEAPIAVSGNTGYSTGPHLHFEIRDTSLNWSIWIADLSGITWYNVNDMCSNPPVGVGVGPSLGGGSQPTSTPTPSSTCSNASSPGSNQVFIYSGAGFSGNCKPLNVGSFSNSGNFNPVGDNDVESLKVGGNVRAWLYADQNYGGTNSLIESDDADLIDNGVGRNTTSSIIVEQKPPPASTNTPVPTSTPTPTPSASRPSNDDFANAQWIYSSAGGQGNSNEGATFENGEPYHYSIGAAAITSVWFRWTAPASGQTTMDTLGSNFDTVLAAYTGSTLGALVQQDANDDYSGYGTKSRISFAAIAGTTYNIAVAGFTGQTGYYYLNWSIAQAPTPTPTPVPQGGPSGYTYCVGEGGTCSFTGVKDVAYGANGRFNYQPGRTGSVACTNGTFGDPISGVYKACYTKDSTSSGGPAGYTFCVSEGSYCSFSGFKDVAYGANGQFRYFTGVSGGISCTNGAFGDPISGVAKACYTRDATSSGGPSGYTRCGGEGQQCSFSGPRDVAYGANGRFSYRYGLASTVSCVNGYFGDPISGIAKACYISASSTGGPVGFAYCANENGTCSISSNQDVAYGANGSFAHRASLSSSVNCANSVFGDPISGIAKKCYSKTSNGGGPAGFGYCATEGGNCSFSGTKTVAYGANGKFFFWTGVSGGSACSNNVFGDPISGVGKKCFIQ